MTDGKAQNSPAPIVLAKGVSRRLPASAVTSPPSPPEETDTWGAGGGGIANLSCSSLDNVDAAGATVGKSMLPFATRYNKSQSYNTYLGCMGQVRALVMVIGLSRVHLQGVILLGQ